MVRHKSPPARRKFARLSWPVFAMCGLSLLIFSYFLFLRLASKPTLVRQFAARLTVPLPNNATLLYYDNHVDVQCPGPDGVFLVARETGPCVGLNHYVANLRTLLREAYASDRVAVLKPICLCSRHNGMRRVRASWDRYINLDAFGVRFINPADDVLDWVRALGDVQVLKGSRKHVDFDRVRDSRARAVVRVLPDEREFVAAGWGVAAEENRRADGFKPRLEESVHIHNAAMAARAELDRFGPSFVCVRARRGDKLKGFAHQLMYPCLSKCTRPANIAFVLKAHSVPLNETVYLMSDEKKPGFFEPLRTEHGFTNLRTMKDLVNIKDVAKFDNFFAFAVEYVFWLLFPADTRCKRAGTSPFAPRVSLRVLGLNCIHNIDQTCVHRMLSIRLLSCTASLSQASHVQACAWRDWNFSRWRWGAESI